MHCIRNWIPQKKMPQIQTDCRNLNFWSQAFTKKKLTLFSMLHLFFTFLMLTYKIYSFNKV